MTEIVLEEAFSEEGQYLGKTTIPRENLMKKMKELWPDEKLAPMAEESVIPLAALREMPWVAFMKSDIAGKNIQGYKRHQAALKKHGVDV